ncbi:7024_t:CDS:2 [Entrophospora sp. SA101]|nr:7024_t:CDS:2 [Entrophospora sp. SA101]
MVKTGKLNITDIPDTFTQEKNYVQSYWFITCDRVTEGCNCELYEGVAVCEEIQIFYNHL